MFETEDVLGAVIVGVTGAELEDGMSMGNQSAPAVRGRKSRTAAFARFIVFVWAVYWLVMGFTALWPQYAATGWQANYLQPAVIMGLIALPLLTVWRLKGFTAVLLLLEVGAGLYYFRIPELLFNPALVAIDAVMIAAMFIPPFVAALLLIRAVFDEPRRRPEPVRTYRSDQQESRLVEEPAGHDVHRAAS